MAKTIYFITGASGVGKTTLMKELKTKYNDINSEFLHFDSVGIPSVDEMNKEYGSPSAWQEAMTHQWVDRLLNDYQAEQVFFEGQVNLQFILDAFRKNNFTNFKIILLDCSEEEMAHRLIHKRKQSELLNDDMKNWLRFLRRQGQDLNVDIIETTGLDERSLIDKFEKVVSLK